MYANLKFFGNWKFNFIFYMNKKGSREQEEGNKFHSERKKW